jgi:hypothetical protein
MSEDAAFSDMRAEEEIEEMKEKIGFNTLLLLANLTAVTALTLVLAADQPVQVNTTQVNVTEEKVEPNVSVKAPPPEVTVQSEYHHVQNPDAEPPDMIKRHDTLTIQSIDAVSHVYGSSMAPSIMHGDQLLLTKYRGRDLETGEIIRFKDSKDGYTFHRIVGDYEERGYVQTQGDAVDSYQHVRLENVTHVVRGVVYD